MLFVLTGKSSILSSEFNPPVDVSDGTYVLGLTNFEAYNAIPNIEEGRNKFYFGNEEYTIPTGCYQLTDINDYLQKAIFQKDKYAVLDITANNNTLYTHIKATRAIDFSKPNTIRELLGFKPRLINANESTTSDSIADIMKVNAICVECNLTVSSYRNGKAEHIIHQFFPNVPPGFKIVESPDHIIYLPINVASIRNITVKIVDQDGKLINFQTETVTVALHLRKESI